MALRKTLTKRLTDGYKSAVSAAATSDQFWQAAVPPNASKLKILRDYRTSPDHRQSGGLLHRFFHHPVSTNLPEFLSLQVGARLRERLTGIDSEENQIRKQIKALALPPPPPQNAILVARNSKSVTDDLSLSETKKLLRVYQVEKMKSKLRQIPKNSVSYLEFVQICSDGCGNNERGLELAKSLDDSGSVIVLGDIVFLRPEQMAKSMEDLIKQNSTFGNDPRRAELIQLEKTKNMIDLKARLRVQAELYSGLGFLAAQTLGFMRLTFWELSWDVMEPICFFVTSFHFLIGYTFFLRTSTEPTFEGFFGQRFRVKQRKLMEAHGFDLKRYNELKDLFSPSRVSYVSPV